MLNIGYQKRDFDFFDYQLYTIRDPETKKSFVLRGPAASTLEAGRYFSSIGPAFTYGCYTHRPYTKLISDELSFPSINLGVEGAGPSHYTNPDNKLLLDIINRSKFVIVAVMSSRSVSNSLFEVSSHSQEKLSFIGENHYQPAHKLYEWLIKNHHENYVRKIVEETRENFVKEYINLLSQIKVPKILLWFSKRKPQYQEKYDGKVWDLLGKFPHLVNNRVLNSLKTHCDDYVECVTKVGTPQILIDRFSGQPSTVSKNLNYGYSQSNYNMYYASPEMHLDAANSLLKTCGKYIDTSESISLTGFIQPQELIDSLTELHFEKFLLSAKSSDSIVLSELEVKNYIFDKHKQVLKNIVLSDEVVYLNEQNNDSTNYIDLNFNHRHSGIQVKSKLKTKTLYFDFVYDVLPFLLSKPSKVTIEHLIETRSNISSPMNLYAVVCTPRSGSSFICDLLHQNGAGRPLEHLRSPLLYIIKNRQRLDINLELFFQRILFFCSNNKLFGTKVISHFFVDFMEILDENEINKMMHFFRYFKVIYLYRHDKYAQAASKYLASKSKFWHSTSTKQSMSEYQDNVKNIEYNFESVKKIYEQLLSDEKRLEDLIDNYGLKNVIKIDYEQLKNNLEKEMRKIIEFLGIKAEELNLESEFQVLSSSYSQELIDRFKQEYETKPAANAS
jgi:LPS sulfotransferase NodH